MIVLGLGSNVGDRRSHLQAAIRELSPILSGMRLSRVLESKALLPEGAPAHWNAPFLNMAVAGLASHPLPVLLVHLKTIERKLGRRPAGHHGPREIDIDILAAAETLDTPSLRVPHSELLNRDFALLPLIDVAPHWCYPLAGTYHQWPAERIAKAKGYALGSHLRDTGIQLHAA